MNRSYLPLLAMIVLGCTDYELHGNDGSYGPMDPQIKVSPETVHFGSLGRDEMAIETFTVENIGGGDLDVEYMSIANGVEGFTILSTETSFMLAPSATKEIDVQFTPFGADEQWAEVIVASNDEQTPKASVELVGEGVVPDLEIDPDPYDFGTTYVGCPGEGLIDLVNVGYDTLIIDGISLDGGSTFDLDSSGVSLPVTLEPGEHETVTVFFEPGDDQTHESSLTVTHDAPGGVDIGEQYGNGAYAGEYSDLWEISGDPPVDLMFFVDQSGSMDDDQTSLGNNFSSFISQLSSYTSDWQVTVVNDDDGCTNSGVLTASTNNYQNTFASAVRQGGGWYTEAGLYVTAAGVENTDPGECNNSFMREDALLHIVMVSDEPEQSPASWSSYVNAVIAKKGSSANVRFSAIAGDYPGGCGTADAGTGYYEAVSATGGVFLSICSNWASNMEALADASVQLTDFELSHTAVEDSIVVYVDGTQRNNGWTYDGVNNAVVFSANIPEEGETVQIDYAAAANCD